ncbi:MAG: hypothetical protein HQ510_02850 [Candidatus Marinimicrobia bacterium]|nr:hypothetical protein [Candidatus Neomarinimicrobiota bacterium]
MNQTNHHFLGIDLGSSFTKFVVTDESGKKVDHAVVPTLSRNKHSFDDQHQKIRDKYSIRKVCATGYGRDSIQSDMKKTELICASVGISSLFPQRKNILDIGGEDIKIIESEADGQVIGFHMNDKCSAGTGTFITEIAEKAELEISEMSELAEKSTAARIINSFCTVFAKTEILGWKFEDVPIEDISRGIYLSIVNRITKLPLRMDLPVFLCGGVIAYHPFLISLLTQELGVKVQATPDPQFMVALGAAVLAGKR